MSRRPSPSDRPIDTDRKRLRDAKVWEQMLWPAIVAVLACLWVGTEIDSAGGDPQLREGPGVTIDEVFNVQERVLFVAGLKAYGPLGLTHPDSIREIFGHLPDHPPLGRWWIGIVHDLVNAFRWDGSPEGQFPDANVTSQFVINSARVAPVTAFGLLIVAIGTFTSRWYGQVAGVLAAVSLLTFPRLVGHAHLAVLETFVTLTYTLAVLTAAELWGRGKNVSAEANPESTGPPGWRNHICVGVMFGLALLTKIKEVLLPIPLAIWTVWRWRTRAIVPLLACWLVGGIVFFVGWPWLWLDPVGNAVAYFASTTERASLAVWYLGQQFADKSVPWHYPWVMSAVTIPVGTLGLACYGIWLNRATLRRPTREALLLGNILFPLVVFSLPGVAVYDGVRLFLMVFPLLAVFVGFGASRLWEIASNSHPHRVWQIAFVAFFAAQFSGLGMTTPCYLSYYNLIVGGPGGAESLGFETTYWGDSLTRSLLREVAERLPADSELDVAPVLHPFQLQTLEEQCPALHNRRIHLLPYKNDSSQTSRPLLVFFRRSALPSELRNLASQSQPTAAVRRGGATLAGFYTKPAISGE